MAYNIKVDMYNSSKAGKNSEEFSVPLCHKSVVKNELTFSPP